MSDTEEKGTNSGMSADEVKFLMACLNNTTGGGITVDTAAIAEALNYKNPKSVANRLSAMKKKYGFPISGSGSGAKSGAASGGASNGDAVAIPKTPDKNRVKKAAPARKKAASKKAAKSDEHVEQDAGDNEENEDEVAEEEEGEEAAEPAKATAGRKRVAKKDQKEI
ncbi:hypothetical protein PVAG01_07729 [Phlyctema vagabunda]|uniref:Myb-like DNA-binding domain-containing protein n=1 Tax=Phlyctema vagabunda TaxID=108571 RepID=A0ABR4PD88_9HELO